MTREDIDALFARIDKALPVAAEWREGTQTGTRRAYLPVVVEGASTGLRLAITCKLASEAYLVINMLAGRSCIARLCLDGGHRDRLTRKTIVEGHYHRWQDNRPSGSKVARVPRLERQVSLPPGVVSRDDALSVFLTDCGIMRPRWWPMAWPSGQVFL
jgi:hypothetical protein